MLHIWCTCAAHRCKVYEMEQSGWQVHWLSQAAWPHLSTGASDGCCWLHTAPCCGARDKLQPRAQVASFAIVSGQFFRLINEIFTSECETCRGSGRIICKHCRGSKTLRRRQGVFTIQRLQVVDRDPADMCATACVFDALYALVVDRDPADMCAAACVYDALKAQVVDRDPADMCAAACVFDALYALPARSVSCRPGGILFAHQPLRYGN